MLRRQTEAALLKQPTLNTGLLIRQLPWADGVLQTGCYISSERFRVYSKEDRGMKHYGFYHYSLHGFSSHFSFITYCLEGTGFCMSCLHLGSRSCFHMFIWHYWLFAWSESKAGNCHHACLFHSVLISFLLSSSSSQENFGGSTLIVPDLEGTLYLKEDDKKTWKPRYFVLRASGIYYVPKGKTKVWQIKETLALYVILNVNCCFCCTRAVALDIRE